MTKSSASIERIVVRGHCSPSVAARAMELTLKMNDDLTDALLMVEDERARQRLRQCAKSLLLEQLEELMRQKEVLQ